jgi:hypothetical protein
MTDKTLIDEIAETVGHDLNIRIQDGEFIVTPAEAGIAMLAAMSEQAGAEDRIWSQVDALSKQAEKLRVENAKYRDLLESLTILLEQLGYDDRAHDIERALWPVVGVLEDGTEISYEYYDADEDDDADLHCTYCANGWACDCAGAQ